MTRGRERSYDAAGIVGVLYEVEKRAIRVGGGFLGGLAVARYTCRAGPILCVGGFLVGTQLGSLVEDVFVRIANAPWER